MENDSGGGERRGGENLRLYVHTILDSFWTGTKTTQDRASVYTRERWFWRDFCHGAKLRRAESQSANIA